MNIDESNFFGCEEIDELNFFVAEKGGNVNQNIEVKRRT